MINPIQVNTGVYRGPSPQTQDDWAVLQKLGIKYTLDLQTGAQLMGDGSPLWEQLAAELYDIKAYCHPLGEFLPPTNLELRDALTCIRRNQPIYVHCKYGRDRTGMVIARWRMANGWDRQHAIDEMYSMGMHWWFKLLWTWRL